MLTPFSLNQKFTPAASNDGLTDLGTRLVTVSLEEKYNTLDAVCIIEYTCILYFITNSREF